MSSSALTTPVKLGSSLSCEAKRGFEKDSDDFTFAWNNEDHANAVLNLVCDELDDADGVYPPRGHTDASSPREDEETATDGTGSRKRRRCDPEVGQLASAVACRDVGSAASMAIDVATSTMTEVVSGAVLPSRVRERIFVSTAIIGARSQMLQKLFSTPLKEKRHKEAHLLLARQEVPLMVVMLRLIYGHSDALQDLDLSSLLHLLVLCDRYDAPWCLRLTCAHLTSSPLVADLASADEVIAFIDDMLPHLRSASAVTELLAHARERIQMKFGDLDTIMSHLSPKGDFAMCVEFQQLSLPALKGLLADERTRVKSENTVFTLVTQWLKRHRHLKTDDERCAAFRELAPLIRFPQCSGGYLLDLVGKYRHMDPVLEREALQYKVARPERRELWRKAAGQLHQRFSERPGVRQPGECAELQWEVTLPEARVLSDARPLTSSKIFVDGYLVYVQMTRVVEGAVVRPALQLIILSVDETEVVPGGAGITYRIQIRTRTPTQPLVLERDDFMHNLSPGKKTMLHGRIHYFFESWDDVMREDNDIWLDGVMHLTVGVEVLG